MFMTTQPRPHVRAFLCLPRGARNGRGPAAGWRAMATGLMLAALPAPSYVDGGVVLAVLDEAMARATIALAGSFAVTKETTTRFRAPVHVDGAYRVRAEIEQDDGDELRCRAEVTDRDGRLCATARATFVPLGPAQALDAIGTTVTGDDARYVRGAERVER